MVVCGQPVAELTMWGMPLKMLVCTRPPLHRGICYHINGDLFIGSARTIMGRLMTADRGHGFTLCPNCREDQPHFVPPSDTCDTGFYLCGGGEPLRAYDPSELVFSPLQAVV